MRYARSIATRLSNLKSVGLSGDVLSYSSVHCGLPLVVGAPGAVVCMLARKAHSDADASVGGSCRDGV